MRGEGAAVRDRPSGAAGRGSLDKTRRVCRSERSSCSAHAESRNGCEEGSGGAGCGTGKEEGRGRSAARGEEWWRRVQWGCMEVLGGCGAEAEKEDIEGG
jgi:hypothetical protein